MQCPYCYKRLKNGYIESYDLLSWTPEGKSNGILPWTIHKDGVKLGKYRFMDSCKVDAYYCEHCQKIIIEIPQNLK